MSTMADGDSQSIRDADLTQSPGPTATHEGEPPLQHDGNEVHAPGQQEPSRVPPVAAADSASCDEVRLGNRPDSSVNESGESPNAAREPPGELIDFLGDGFTSSGLLVQKPHTEANSRTSSVENSTLQGERPRRALLGLDERHAGAAEALPLGLVADAKSQTAERVSDTTDAASELGTGKASAAELQNVREREAELKRLREENKILKEELERKTSEASQELEAAKLKNETLTSKNEALTGELAEYKAKLEDAQRNLQASKENEKKLHKRLSELKDESSKQTIEWKAQVENLNQEIKVLKSLNKDLNRQIKNMETVNDKLQKKLQETETKMRKEFNQKLSDEVGTLRDEIDSLRQQVSLSNSQQVNTVPVQESFSSTDPSFQAVVCTDDQGETTAVTVGSATSTGVVRSQSLVSASTVAVSESASSHSPNSSRVVIAGATECRRTAVSSTAREQVIDNATAGPASAAASATINSPTHLSMAAANKTTQDEAGTIFVPMSVFALHFQYIVINEITTTWPHLQVCVAASHTLSALLQSLQEQPIRGSAGQRAACRLSTDLGLPAEQLCELIDLCSDLEEAVKTLKAEGYKHQLQVPAALVSRESMLCTEPQHELPWLNVFKQLQSQSQDVVDRLVKCKSFNKRLAFITGKR